MRMDLEIRFEYGSIVPWVRTVDGQLVAIAGPDGLALWTTVPTRGESMRTVAEFSLREGQQVPFVLTYFPSHGEVARPVAAQFAIEETKRWWQEWADLSNFEPHEWRDAVVRSLITLKALTYAPTGGIIAAATTSLPESLGGERNWDYRYCWLRDATLTLSSLMAAGYREEAAEWRDWLLRAVAGDPSELQIMYGAAGERNLKEEVIAWLPGYEDSAPVRVGNAAAGQYQLDVYGEVLGALHEARRTGLEPAGPAWDLELALMDFIESGWKRPDDGIWEVRGPRRHFTHSKVDGVGGRRPRRFTTSRITASRGPSTKWRSLRQEIHAEVCEKGFDAERNTFTQYYGSKELDASVLMIPIVGFLPPKDSRVVGTVEAIRQQLTVDGFVSRYDSEKLRAGRRADGPRGGVLGVLVLDGRRPAPHRAARRGRRAVRAAVVAAQRPRPAGRGVRPDRQTPRRQLSPGLLPRLARQHDGRSSRAATTASATRDRLAGMPPLKGRGAKLRGASQAPVDRRMRAVLRSHRRGRTAPTGRGRP